MARRRPPESTENHERWMVSYADFITLLFAFFVVMYSTSAANYGDFARVVGLHRGRAFGLPGRPWNPQEGVLVRQRQQATTAGGTGECR
jgi:chemotaxis protein MotB